MSLLSSGVHFIAVLLLVDDHSCILLATGHYCLLRPFFLLSSIRYTSILAIIYCDRNRKIQHISTGFEGEYFSIAPLPSSASYLIGALLVLSDCLLIC